MSNFLKVISCYIEILQVADFYTSSSSLHGSKSVSDTIDLFLDDEIELNFESNVTQVTQKSVTIKQNESKYSTSEPPSTLSRLQKSIDNVVQKLQNNENDLEVNKIDDNKNLNQEGEFLNLKPLLNMTINALGIFSDVNHDEPFDPSDTKRVLHSMFQIWNPQVNLIKFKFNFSWPYKIITLIFFHYHDSSSSMNQKCLLVC